jgi:tetratricopeptide (TPR) repeat protein
VTRTGVWAAAVAVLVGSAAGADAQRAAAGRQLVVPFDAGRDARAAWLGEGIALQLADDLNELGADAIARDERVRAFDRLQVPLAATLTRGTVIRIGQLVGATTVVTGRVELADRTLAVHVQAIRIDTGRISAEFAERGPLDELPAIVERAARRLVPAGTPPPASAPRAQEPSLAAYEQFVRGLLAETPAAQVAYLEKALTLAPGYDRARLALGRAYAVTGGWTAAREAALGVPPASPFAPRAQFEAAVAEIALKRYDEAFDRLKALADRTDAPEAFNNLGVIQLRRGATAQGGRATYFFNKAVERDPAQADYAFNLGYAYWREQDHQAALYWLREAVRRDPGGSDAHVVLAAALQATGAATEAARERELARRLSAEYEEQAGAPAAEAVPAGLERLRPYLDPPGARRTDTALMATEQRGQRELVAFHLDRGRRFYERENDRDALMELQRAIYLAPYQAEAHLLVGRIHLRAGRIGEAIAAFKIALWSEASAAGHAALGEAYRQAKDLAAARREAGQALAMSPGHPEATALMEKLK